MEIILKNLRQVFSKKEYIALFLLLITILGSIVFKFTNYALITGNFGLGRANFDVITSFFIVILFATFVCVQVYKIRIFKSFDKKESSSSLLGTFFGILVAGCPACSITIASYLGLASILVLLPYNGLELKILGLLLLVYANYSLLKNLETCELKRKK